MSYKWEVELRRNPCFTGSQFQTKENGENIKPSNKVVILVLLEVSFKLSKYIDERDKISKKS